MRIVNFERNVSFHAVALLGFVKREHHALIIHYSQGMRSLISLRGYFAHDEKLSRRREAELLSARASRWAITKF